MTFDDEADDVSPDVIRSVAAEISGGGLQPLSDEEKLQRQIEWQNRREEEEFWRIERERERAGKEMEERRSLALAAEREAHKASLERQREIDRQVTQRSLFNLGMSAARQDAFQRNVENAHAQNVKQQYRQTLLGELDAMIAAKFAAPEPEPEPEDEPGSHFGDPGFSVEAWSRRRRRWF
jgi:hypothetical protein